MNIEKNKISAGVIHKVPLDLKEAIASTREILGLWNDLTPLARNEWICWIESAKKPETRSHRIKRTVSELMEGKRRPCCWAGCPHR